MLAGAHVGFCWEHVSNYTSSDTDSVWFTPASTAEHHVVAKSGTGTAYIDVSIYQNGVLKCQARAAHNTPPFTPSVDCDEATLSGSVSALLRIAATVYSGTATAYAFDNSSSYAQQVFCSEGGGN